MQPEHTRTRTVTVLHHSCVCIQAEHERAKIMIFFLWTLHAVIARDCARAYRRDKSIHVRARAPVSCAVNEFHERARVCVVSNCSHGHYVNEYVPIMIYVRITDNDRSLSIILLVQSHACGACMVACFHAIRRM